jgi:hypothetical protein
MVLEDMREYPETLLVPGIFGKFLAGRETSGLLGLKIPSCLEFFQGFSIQNRCEFKNIWTV